MGGILLNLLAATTGGQVTRAEAFTKRFRRYDPESSLLIVKDACSLAFCDTDESWETINVPIGGGAFRSIRRMAWENRNLPGIVAASGAELYLTFSHYLPPSLSGRIRSVVGVSNLAPFSKEAWAVESNFVRMKMWLLRRTILLSTRKADRVIALSNACKDILVEHGIPATRIQVIPNGVDIPEAAVNESAAAGRLAASEYILTISHFYRYKNFERIVKAYHSLPDSIGNRFHLIIIGKPYDTAYYREILALIDKLGLSDRVHLIPGLGKLELDNYYRNAALFVFASLIENSPNILLEAMAYGLPVVASNSAPMPEFGADGVEYFESLSVHDLTNKMSRLLSVSEFSEALRRRALQRAGQFSWDGFTEAVVNTCKEEMAAAASLQ